MNWDSPYPYLVGTLWEPTKVLNSWFKRESVVYGDIGSHVIDIGESVVVIDRAGMKLEIMHDGKNYWVSEFELLERCVSSCEHVVN